MSLLTTWVGLVGAAGCGDSASKPIDGEDRYLEGRGGGPAYVSYDTTAHEQLMIFLRAGREGSVRGLIAKGKVIVCPSGTTVTVVTAGPAASTVRITSGKYSSKTGIVANECLRK